MIRVTHQPIDLAEELKALENNGNVGAAVTFTGFVRNDGENLQTLTLEHWPGATERALEKIAAEANERFELDGTFIVHRHGEMQVGDLIVLVATQSRHRDAAFDAARFIMDYLKTDAPFWKKVTRMDGSEEWVDATARDDAAKAKWQED